MKFFKNEYNDELNNQESLKRITSSNFAYTDTDVAKFQLMVLILTQGQSSCLQSMIQLNSML